MEGVPYIFQWDGGGNEVFLVGSFNSWEKIRVNNSNGLGGVCIDLMLPVGTHNYMFIVDGEWKLDPSNTLPTTSTGQNQVSITGGLQLDNSDSSDGVDSDTESMASQASSSGSGPKGQRMEKLYVTFPEAAKDQLHGYLTSSSYKDNIINVHYLNGYSAIVMVTPPSAAESVIAVMNGAMISKHFRLKVKKYERKSRPSKTKPEAKVGGAVIATGGSGSDSETFSVYVGSKLPEYTNEQHLREHFKRFASSIVGVELVKNKKTKKFQGFAFVHFSTAKSAHASIRALNHSNLLGVCVKVSLANNPKKEEPDAGLISHSFGPAGQGEIFSLPQENPLPIFSQPANEGDQDLSDNESISSNMSAYTDKVKVIIHSTPKFPDRLSNRAFKKHFKEIESAVCRAFIARNNKTRKSLGFGIIFFSSMDLAQFAKGKYVNTVIDEKYKIISMGIEGSGDSRPPKGGTSPHLTGIGQNHSQFSAPHPKGNRKSSDPHPTRGDVRGSGPRPRNVRIGSDPNPAVVVNPSVSSPLFPGITLKELSISEVTVPYQQSHGNPQPHHPNPQPHYPNPQPHYPNPAPEDCVVVENIDSSIGESEVSSLLAPIKMLSFNRSPNGVVTIKLYSYNDSRTAVLKLNGMTFLGCSLRAYIPNPPPGGPNPSALHGPCANYPQTLQPAFTNQYPPTQANIPCAVQGRPAMEVTQPRLEHSQSHPPHPMQGVNRPPMHVRPPMPGNMPPNMGGNSVPNYGHSQSFPHGAAIQDPSVQNNPFLSPKKTQPGTAVKVTHLPPAVTGEKLYLHFRQVGEINGQPVIHATAKSIYAHVNFFHPHVAEHAVSRLDQSVLDGTIIRVKLSTGSPTKNPVAKSDPDSCIEQLKFDPKQWNSLMLLNSRGTSQFKEISAPFASNPNVVISRNDDDQTIKFTGKQEAVQAAYDHLRKHLNKELPIERIQMEVLVRLMPSLPDQIYQKYSVRVLDYTTGVTTIRFEGDLSGIEKAHTEINDLVISLLRRDVPVQEYELDRLEKAQKQIKEPVLVFPPEGLPRNSVIFYSFQEASFQSVIPFVVQFLSVSQIPLECKGEEVVYLKHFNRAYVSKLPVTITFKNDTALLSGTEGDVRITIEKIQRDILAGLLSRKFIFSCHSKDREQIEQRILQPLQSENSEFKYFITSGQRKEKTRRKGNRASTESNEEFSVYVYCKDQYLFEKTCHILQRVNPSSREYRVNQEEGKQIVMGMKIALENEFYVRIETRPSSFIIFGLIPEDVEKCLEEIKEKVGSKLMIFGFIPITPHMHDLLNCYYQEDLQKLRKDCAELILLKPNKDHENFSIRLRGSINQVNDVKKRLNSGILSMNISMENFTLTCPAGLFGMWCQRWKQIREQEGRRSKIWVGFSKSSEASSGNNLSIKFEVVGEDEIGVQEIKNSIVTEGAQTEEKIISLSPAGINCLLKAKRDKNLNFLNNVIVNVGNIDKQSHSVTVIAPKELSDNLDTAEEQIRKFVGDRANTSHVVSSRDPVVGLILASPTYSIPYVTSANDIAKSKGASVHLLRKPSIGLRISGTESSIAAVKGLIYSTVIEAIEKTISERQVSVKPIYIPLLSTSDFSRFESKLETDLCVKCSRPRIGKTSKLICSSFIHLEKPGSYVKLDICKGNIVFEEVDAIVNAANEDLKHIGGLAKSISDAGGPSIQMDSDNFIRTNSQVKPGKAVCLGSGDLPCKNVIHAVGPRWYGGQRGEEQTLYYVIFECLKLAGDASLTSIALPAIGTGIFAVPEAICARASLKAVKDYFQMVPNGSIQNVRFILFQQTTLENFKPLLESGLFGEYQGTRSSSNKSKLSTLSGHLPNPSATAAHYWQWYNDQGSFSYYDSKVSSILTSAYQSNPQGSTPVMINSTMYIVDFGKMLQMNTTTNHSRPIYRTLAVSGVHWEYEDNRVFLPYSKEQSGTIETMYSTKSPGQLVIKDKVYTFDFNQMCQINVSTGFKRSVRRIDSVGSEAASPVGTVCAEFEEDGVEAKKALIVSLRGPHKDLETAERKLMAKLKGSVNIQRIDTLPKKTTPSLEKKLSQIASKNDVVSSFEEGGKKRVLKLEGVYFKLQAAVSAIQEEILNFHDTSMPSDEMVYPQEWVAQTHDIEVFALPQGSQEWVTVQAKFSLTMSGHVISKITRIQNKWLWEKYERHKKRMDHKNNGLVNEKELFHGTRGNNPVNIYRGEEGFDMRFCSKGMWGIANYFAVNASYSHGYAHQGVGGQEMFLVKVLTGDSCSCPSSVSLRMPPVKNQAGQFAQMKYDTITGNTHGSDVYMTYDNDKSYPAYLITYN